MKSPAWSGEQQIGLAKAFDLMNAWRFHDAHDQFEDLWRAAQVPERTWLHGLTQLAASLHQLTLGRGAASVRTLSRARSKLEGLALEEFVTRMDALHHALGLRSDGPRFFDVGALVGHSLPRLEAATLHSPSK